MLWNEIINSVDCYTKYDNKHSRKYKSGKSILSMLWVFRQCAVICLFVYTISETFGDLGPICNDYFTIVVIWLYLKASQDLILFFTSFHASISLVTLNINTSIKNGLFQKYFLFWSLLILINRKENKIDIIGVFRSIENVELKIPTWTDILRT